MAGGLGAKGAPSTFPAFTGAVSAEHGYAIPNALTLNDWRTRSVNADGQTSAWALV